MFQDIPIKPPYEQVEKVSSNALTLRSYEESVQEYIYGTPAEVSGDFKKWIDEVLSHLPANAQVFEIGSGAGRDAAYMESLGFQVERTDATEGFVVFLQEQGYDARMFNALTDEFTSQYDLIFASGVFLHFTPQELSNVLEKINAALKSQGLLAFSVKKGEGEAWTAAKVGRPRYFCYWTKDTLAPVLQQLGFEVVYISETEQFLQIIARSAHN